MLSRLPQDERLKDSKTSFSFHCSYFPGGSCSRCMRQTSLVIVAVALAVVGVGVGVATTSATPSQQLDSPAQSSEAQTITVSASGSASANSDQMTIRIAVEATGENAPAVRQRLAENVSQMRAALTDIGLSSDQIRTTRYDLEQDRRPPREEGGQPQLQYRGRHSFTITVTDLNRTGQIIDTAVRNGADNIEDIRFTLSAEQRNSLRQQALQNAMTRARTQAETLATASGLTITGVHTVRTTVREPRHREFAATTSEGGDGGAATQINRGSVDVTAQVQVTYNATAAS